MTDPEKPRTLRYKLTDAQLARIRRLNREELEKLSTAFADAVDLYQHQGLGFW
ncbi:MAG: hypothetical protein HZY76_20070 [Anaerolineae bacterium]|nr:MAG: hypothetical protein HZY76_20070 [Anaerolineae bacterium]